MKLLLGIALLAAACGTEQGSASSSLTRAPGACGGFETHVLGVYDPPADTTVVVSRQGKQALVLSAHGPTTWHVKVGPGVVLEHIYAVGYHTQQVDAPPGIDVITESHDDGGADANGYIWPSANASHLLELVAARVHHEATSFHGCERASTWEIGRDMAVTSDCDATAGQTQYDAVLRCEPTDSGSGCGSGSGSDGSGSDSGSGSSGGDGPVT